MLSLKNLTAAVVLGAAMLATPAMVDAMPSNPTTHTPSHTTYSVKHKKHKKHRKHGHKHASATHKSATPASSGRRHHPQV